MKRLTAVCLLVIFALHMIGCTGSGVETDYPAAIMVDNEIYLFSSQPLAAEVDESAIIGQTKSYTDTYPEKNFETNFNRELGMTVARVREGIAVLYNNEWHLCTLHGGNNQEAIDIDYNVQYIRTDGYHEDATYPTYCVIESREQLTAYYEDFKELYFLERRENPPSDMTIGFLDACDAYDDEFFKANSLVLVLLEEGSGSIRHKVTGVQSVNSRLIISIESIIPEVGTDDMAEWHIMIALEKEYVPILGEDVEIRYNCK